jgi:hypothetical protein
MALRCLGIGPVGFDARLRLAEEVKRGVRRGGRCSGNKLEESSIAERRYEIDNEQIHS